MMVKVEKMLDVAPGYVPLKGQSFNSSSVLYARVLEGQTIRTLFGYNGVGDEVVCM